MLTLCKHCFRFKRVRVNVAEPSRDGTKPGQGRVETSSCSRISADKLAANRSTKGTASASGTVRGKLINAVNLYVKVGI